jgi:hypothetical protein
MQASLQMGSEDGGSFLLALEICRLPIYDTGLISGFKDAETEKILNGLRSRRFEAIADTAYRKLAFLHSAGTLRDLKSPGLH